MPQKGVGGATRPDGYPTRRKNRPALPGPASEPLATTSDGAVSTCELAASGGAGFITQCAAPSASRMGKVRSEQYMSSIVQELLEDGQVHGALVAARAVTEADPGDAGAWADRGDVLLELDRFHEAIAAYVRAEEIAGPLFGVLVGKAEAQAELGQYEAAAGCYAAALKIDPGDRGAMVGRAYCLLETSRLRREDGAAKEAIDEAAELAERAMKGGDGTIEHPFPILEILTLAGRHQDAYEVAYIILENDPADAETRAYRSDHLRALGMHDDALADGEEATRADPHNAHAWRARGAAQRALGMHLEALESLKRALAIDPCDAEGWRDRAEALAELGKRPEAADSLLVAVSLDPRLARDLDRPVWDFCRDGVRGRLPV